MTISYYYYYAYIYFFIALLSSFIDRVAGTMNMKLDSKLGQILNLSMNGKKIKIKIIIRHQHVYVRKLFI